MSLNKRPEVGHGGDGFGSGFPWLLCDLMPHGKRVVRGSPDTPDAFWTFCPKMKFPRDKIKISECEKCNHFHGYRKTFSDKVVKSLKDFGTPIRAFQRKKGGVQGVQGYLDKHKQQQGQEQKSPSMDMTIKKPTKKLKPKRKMDIEQAVREKERKDKEWEEEEKRLMGG